jgi:phosphopantetheinyl transferase (holo-ACP synthase)
MSEPQYRFRSALATLAIDAVKRQPADERMMSFSPEERRQLADAPVQTIAGRLAAKQAVRTLLAETASPAVSDADFEIVADAHGAPHLRDWPALALRAALSPRSELGLSISHTRDHAYGLAVLQERLDDDAGR